MYSLSPFCSYEEFLELSQRGNNLAVDLTVGDIYGKQGYPKVKFPQYLYYKVVMIY